MRQVNKYILGGLRNLRSRRTLWQHTHKNFIFSVENGGLSSEECSFPAQSKSSEITFSSAYVTFSNLFSDGPGTPIKVQKVSPVR
jgi:hypothetical protein